MRREQGQLTITSPDSIEEMSTVTCAHCQTIVIVKAKADPSELGGFCRQCMKHICGREACHARCVPFELKLLEMERRAAMLRAITGGD